VASHGGRTKERAVGIKMGSNIQLGSFKKDKALRSRSVNFTGGWLIKKPEIEKRLYLIISDIVAMMLCVVLGYYLAGAARKLWLPEIPSLPVDAAVMQFPLLFGVPFLLIVLLSEHLGHYNRFKPFWDEYADYLMALAVVAGVSTFYLFFTKTQISRSWIGAVWLLAAFLVPIARVMTKRILMLKGRWFEDVVVIGSGRNALEAALAIESNILMGFRVRSLIEPKRVGVDLPQAREIKDFLSGENVRYPVVALETDCSSQLEKMGWPYVVLALDYEDYVERRQMVQRIMAEHPTMSVIPPIKGMPLVGAEISPIFRHEVLHLRIKNNLARRLPRLVKRGFDFLASLVLLLVLSPILLVLGWMVRQDGGPAVFSQERVGKGGKIFKCHKFRTMRVDAEKILKELLESDEQKKLEWERERKLRDDPRITAIGEFLRKTSLDELPQLVNVLKGEMSLVGPRPVTESELSRYGDQVGYYYQTPPGISGLWQISGRNDIDYETRVTLDSWYVRNWSLWYDLVILFKTVRVVFRGSGAY